MARTSEDYLAPPIGRGPLTADMFPEDGDAGVGRVEDLIEAGFLLAASAASLATGEARDAALDDYVYWKAYDAVGKRLLALPASGQLDGGEVSVSFTDTQRQTFLDLAKEHKTAWLTAIATPTQTPAINQFPSGATRVISEF